MVSEVVVVDAPQDEQVQIGWSVLGVPFEDVVDLTPFGGMVHPGIRHPPSRATSAVYWASEANRLVRPRSRGIESEMRRRWMLALVHIRLTISAGMMVPSDARPAPG